MTVAAEVVDSAKVVGRTQSINIWRGVGTGRRCAACVYAARPASGACGGTCGARGIGWGSPPREERTKPEATLGHLVDVVRAGLVDCRVAYISHRDRSIMCDLLFNGDVPLPSIGSDSKRRTTAAWGSGRTSQRNGGIQGTDDAGAD